MTSCTFLVLGLVLFALSHTAVAFPSSGSTRSTKNDALRKTPNFGKDPLRCDLCLEAMKEIFRIATANRTEQCLEALVDKACVILQIEDSTVCKGAITEYGNIFLYVIDSLIFDPKLICGGLYEGCGGPDPDVRPDDYWRVPMTNTTKPPRQKPVLPAPGKPTLRVVHLTDLHFDKDYAVGSEADCNEPLCCRQTNATEIKQPAGKWGISGICDLPIWTLENMFQHLASRNDYDYIIWTGDAPPHNIWDQTKDDQLEVLDTLTELFKKYFSDQLLISAVGNHESAPANTFPPHASDIPSQYSIDWLYQTFADQWTQFGIGNDSETYNSILNTASYVTKPYPGLRVISLNTMYGLHGNFFLYLNEYDPDNALAWLIQELQDAEDAEDKVHIIGHIMPGSGAELEEWSANFYDIVNRYENTITGMFFGDSHKDTFTVFYENGTVGDPTLVAYVGPSGTAFTRVWPAFHIYTIDGNYNGSSYRVLDHETYMLNLTEANASDNPQWQFEYSAKEAYGMDSLLPDAWDEMINRFIEDDDLFQQYWRYSWRAPVDPCTDACKHATLCVMRTGRSHDDSFCEDLPGYTKSVRSTAEKRESVRRRIKREFSVLPEACQF